MNSILFVVALFLAIASFLGESTAECCSSNGKLACCNVRSGDCNFFCCNCDGGCLPQNECSFSWDLVLQGVSLASSAFGKRKRRDTTGTAVMNAREHFDAIDQNRDGVLDLLEVHQYANNTLMGGASNKNGSGYPLLKIEIELKKIDTNKDGRVHPHEFDNGL